MHANRRRAARWGTRATSAALPFIFAAFAGCSSSTGDSPFGIGSLRSGLAATTTSTTSSTPTTATTTSTTSPTPTTSPTAISHHIDLEPGGENPDTARMAAMARGVLVPRDPVSLPPPDIALKNLEDALSRLAATYSPTAPEPGRLQKLIAALELVERGRASLSTYEFCAGGGGLTRWLGEQRASDAVEAVKGAKHDVCAQVNGYQLEDAPPTLSLDHRNDGYGGLLYDDPMYPQASPFQDLTISDGHECVVMSAAVPDLPGKASIYELSSYRLPSDPYGGKLDPYATIEEGMKIGTKAVCAPYTKPVADDPCVKYGTQCPIQVQYGAFAELSYDPGGGAITVPFIDVNIDPYADSLDTYQELPPEIFAAALGGPFVTLEYQVYRRECGPKQLPDGVQYVCDKYENLGPKQAMQLHTVPFGSMCQVDYAANEFTINDRNDVNPEDQWLATYVKSIDGPAAFPFLSEFHAWARTPVPDANHPGLDKSSMPDVNPIISGDYFAIHADDDIEGGSAHSLWQQSFFSFNQDEFNKNKMIGPGAGLATADFIKGEGATVLSGLLFPRVVTQNPQNDYKEYSFACKPPRIVRDFVAFCENDPDFPNGTENMPDSRKPDSLYLLPFKGRTSVIQGNDGYYSHKPGTAEQFAYDFTTSDVSDDWVYAARSGVVIVSDGQFDGGISPVAGKCIEDDPNDPGAVLNDPSCHGNWVTVVHQDGTSAEYLHMKYHQVFVKKGALVRRGDAIGVSGMTGHAFNKHIHFDVQDTSADGSGPVPRGVDTSMPATFDRGTEPCGRPDWADLVDSTLTEGNPKTYNWLTNPDYFNKMPPSRYVSPLFCESKAFNACGGCSVLSAQPGDSCGNGGMIVCNGREAVACMDGPNGCGGYTLLQHAPGDPCPGKLSGLCWTCVSPNLMDCEDTCP